MTTKEKVIEALKNVEQAVNVYKGTKNEHLILEEALRVLTGLADEHFTVAKPETDKLKES